MAWHFPYVQARKSAESEKPGTEIKRKRPSLLDMYSGSMYLLEAFKINFFLSLKPKSRFETAFLTF